MAFAAILWSFGPATYHAGSAVAGSVQSPKNTVVFAISGDGGELNMDAVVVMQGSQMRHPYNDEQKDQRTEFGKQYFAAGRQYHLIFGGGRDGSVTVKKWDEGCNNIHAQVTAATTAHIGGQVKALATNSDSLGKRPVSRRAPTEGERAGVMALVKSIYSQHRTPASLISGIKVTNLTATDLNGDGNEELIGSFTLAAKTKFERDLFLIAAPAGKEFRADFVKFQAYQPPPEGFLSNIDFVDQLDLDGDGVGEVFATQGGFDGYGYLIFKKVDGHWRQVHDQIGDAC
jgi:hypothetical protein